MKVRLFFLGCALGLIACSFLWGQDSVVNTPHNLSRTGVGPVTSSIENELCIFCHTPHRARTNAPLWNRSDSVAVYLTYESDTLDAPVGQPNGASMLCLSCHDGTIALGAVLSRSTEIPMNQGHQFITNRANLGTNLRDDHPVSFKYDLAQSQDSELLPSSTLSNAVPLDSEGRMQCTSCHDSHSNTHGNFLKMDNSFSAMCVSCHQKNGWSASAHAISNATWSGSFPNPWAATSWTTVAENACLNCHAVHNAGSSSYLLEYAQEENNCFKCHNSNVAQLDIQSEFNKTYVHPVSQSTGVHSPTESYLSMPRHVECSDCHAPHAARGGMATAPTISPTMEGVSGVSLSGTQLPIASYEYEVCFKCHGDTADTTLRVPRQVVSANTRLEFNTINPSFHPVAGPRNNLEVPSLLPQYTESSMIYCSDCHGNPLGQRLGGVAPDGPHGSSFPHLLSGRYETQDPYQESQAAYALCYRCHSRDSILGDESFKEHDEHIRSEDTPCSVCHDPHGVAIGAGNPNEHTSLINFDLSVVFPDPQTGWLKFEDQGKFKGQCYLLCHGEEHSPKGY